MRTILIFMATIVFYFLMTEITSILNNFYKHAALLLTVLFASTMITLEFGKKNISFYCYLIFVAVFLLFRYRSQSNINFEFYLWKWFKIIADNRIVFINIIGNLVLFVPMIFYVESRYNLLIVFGIILFFESIQFITKRGVFDIVDITLNTIGVIIGKSAQLLFFRRQYIRKENRPFG